MGVMVLLLHGKKEGRLGIDGEQKKSPAAED
jgi:hypothetical protein